MAVRELKMKPNSLRHRIALVYLRAERKRESRSPWNLAEALAFAAARTFIAGRSLWRRLRALSYPSLARGYHQVSGNLARRGHSTAAPVAGRERLGQLPDAWKAPAPEPPAEKLLPLPPAEAIEVGLSQALAWRKSRRNYQAIPLRQTEIATLLGTACGMLPDGRYPFPAGGGINSTRLYVVVMHAVADRDSQCADSGAEYTAAGSYRYRPEAHGLEPIEPEVPPRDLARLIRPDALLERIPAAFVFATHTFSRNERKYGEFGYRLALLEAGHIGQNISLVAAAMGIGCVALGIGNFDVWRANKFLGIDGVDTAIVHTLAVGRVEEMKTSAE